MNPKPARNAMGFAPVVLLFLLVAACRPSVDMSTPTVEPPPRELAEVTGVLTATLTALPTATQLCPTPPGWAVYTIAAGDTLSVLAAATGATVKALITANCLESDVIVVGFTLALPALPPPTLTAVPSATPCGPPSDWGIYLVQPGDTLYALAQQTGVTVAAIQNANCLPDLEIFEGRGLYLPFQPSGVAVGRATGSGGSRESATPAAGGEATPPVCPSEFVCITATELDTPRPLSLGQPNDSGSLCYDAQGNPIVTDQPTIQVGYRSRRLPQIEGTLQEAITRGEWLLMAACNFPDPTTVTIEMYHDAEAIPLVTQRTMVGDRQIVTAAWPALCTVSTAGTYQLTARDGTGVHDSLTFQVDISDPQILAVPYNGAPGAFEIYFCDYASEAGDTINIDLFSHPVRDELNQITYTRRRTDKVFIPLTGWSKVTLILPIKNEESASYLITDDVNDEEKIDIYAE